MPVTPDIPTYMTLGPDPEPLGIRAEVMLERLTAIESEVPCPAR